MKEQRRKLLRKSIYFIIHLIFSVSCFFRAYGADTYKDKPKDIYVVYDSSLSMAKENEFSDCPWYETGYGTEILAALLEKDDKLHIFFMQDDSPYFFNREITNQTTDFHNTLNSMEYSKNTYVNGLNRAVENLQKDKTGERQRYLVIFSDGDFNRDGKTSKKLDYYKEVEMQLDEDVRIIYVALAKDADISKINSHIDYRTVFLSVKDSKDGDDHIFRVLSQLGDLIFDRQELPFIEKEVIDGQKQLSFTTELPVSRMIILGQLKMDKSGSLGNGKESFTGYNSIKIKGDSFRQTAIKEIKGLNRDDFIKTNRLKLSDVKISESKVREGDSQGIVTIWKGRDGDAAPGEYIVTVPANMSINMYVEYNFDYRFVLESNEGSRTILDRNQFCIEGDYVLKTELLNPLTGESIAENAEIYDKLIVSMMLKNGEEEHEITEKNQKITLQEGDVFLSGTLQLQGNSPLEAQKEFRVTHRLGNVGLKNVKFQYSVDVDQLDAEKEGKDIPFVYVEEDGKNISNLLEDEKIILSSKKEYVYKYEKQNDGWVIYPDSNEIISTGLDEVIIQVSGKKDGQAVDVSGKFQADYVAYPQKIEMKYSGFENLNSYSMLFRSLNICPLINEQPLEWMESTGEKETGLTQQRNNQAGGQNPEIVKPEMKFVPDENSGLYFKALERSEDGILEYCIKLDKRKIFPHFWFGGEIGGEIVFTCERYGVISTYDEKFMISFERVGWPLRWVTYVLTTMITCSILGAVIKRIRKTGFYGTSTEVFSEVDYGNGTRIADHHLIIKKHRLRNCFNFWNSKMTVVVGAWGIDKIVLRREGKGVLRILNIQELRKTKKFKAGELPLNGKMRWEDEIKLKILYENSTEIIIRKNGGE